MENINYISGRAPDGRWITLDGFRVESYASYPNDKGNWFVDVYFNSGQGVTMLAENEDFDDIPIPDQLDYCMNADPKVLAMHHPAICVLCRKEDESAFMFNGNDVEFYITRQDVDDSEDETDRDVELHFASGRTVTVHKDPEMDDLDGESIEVFVDDCICRYFKDDDEFE